MGLHHLLSVLVGCLCMLCAGSLYAYGAYSDQLKGRLGWTESDMEAVGYLVRCCLSRGLFRHLPKPLMCPAPRPEATPKQRL